jgi:hypothetical protein
MASGTRIQAVAPRVRWACWHGGGACLEAQAGTSPSRRTPARRDELRLWCCGWQIASLRPARLAAFAAQLKRSSRQQLYAQLCSSLCV